MTVDEFQHAFQTEIKELLARIQRRYSVSDAEVTSAVHASAKKYLSDTLDQTSGNPGPSENPVVRSTRFARRSAPAARAAPPGTKKRAIPRSPGSNARS